MNNTNIFNILINKASNTINNIKVYNIKVKNIKGKNHSLAKVFKTPIFLYLTL